MVRLSIPKNSSGIYQIKSKVNSKIYVGSAVNLFSRKVDHFSKLKKKCHHNIYLQYHYNKYGIEDLVFGIIEFCPKEKLIEREQYWMDTLKPIFNFIKVAGSQLGYKHTEETKQKISITQKGKTLSEETKQKIREANEGRIISEKTRQAVSKARKGIKMSDETKEKMRKHALLNNSFKGKHHTEETKKKISIKNKGKLTGEKNPNYGKDFTGSNNPNYGNKYSCEVRQKMSLNHKDFTGSNNPNYGKHCTAKTKHLISEANKKYQLQYGNPMKGKHHTQQTKDRISYAKRKNIQK
jgi:hypothetical protein